MFHFGWGICFFGGVENAGAGYARPLQSFWQSLSFCTVFFDNFEKDAPQRAQKEINTQKMSGDLIEEGK